MTTISTEIIIKNGKKYFDLQQADENGRYRSWEHCYCVFAKYKDKKLTDDIVDFLCLHLAFYLASWGMLRGSSFLLQKDYKVHAIAVRELMKEKYKGLWAIKCKDYLKDDKNLNCLHSLTNELEHIYKPFRETARESIGKENPGTPISQTLLTKILIGTLGCVPAYDEYFKKGVGECGIAPKTFGINSIHSLSKYYVENEDIETWRQDISHEGVDYPQMKILDMCFWQMGFDPA